MMYSFLCPATLDGSRLQCNPCLKIIGHLCILYFDVFFMIFDMKDDYVKLWGHALY